MTKSMKRILEVVVEVADAEEHGDTFQFLHAMAKVKLTGDLVQTIFSGSISFEIDSIKTDEQLEPYVQDELANLRSELHAIGFPQRAISAAFRNVKRA